MRDVGIIEEAIPSLDVEPALNLRSRIQDRIANPTGRTDWRGITTKVAILIIFMAPVVQFAAKRLAGSYVKGDRIGMLPAFHSKIYGMDSMGPNQVASGDIWFSGFAIRLTISQLDVIDTVEHGNSYQYWKPDGVLQKRIFKWASTSKPVTAAEQNQILDRLGPVVPSFGRKTQEVSGVSIEVFGHHFRTVASTYRLPVTKQGTLSSVETPTTEIVYRNPDTGRIVRVEVVSTFPGGISQTETRDFEYAVPSDAKFETSNLKSSQMTVPAKSATKRGGE